MKNLLNFGRKIFILALITGLMMGAAPERTSTSGRDQPTRTNAAPKDPNFQQYKPSGNRIPIRDDQKVQKVVPERYARVPAVETRIVNEPTIEEPVRLINVGVQEIPQRPRNKVYHERVDFEIPVPVEVPVVEEVVVHKEVEKLYREKPTYIHHVDLHPPEQPASLPVVFAEEVPEDEEGIPWWWWVLPLLCCLGCIPLIAWLLFQKLKKQPKNVAITPVRPVAQKRVVPKVEQPVKVKVEEKKDKRFVIEKHVIDEEADIEQEIQREIRKSKEQKSSAAMISDVGSNRPVNKGSMGGRKRRIKTIKKNGEVIGREEQIVDADGNVISSKKIGVDEQSIPVDNNRDITPLSVGSHNVLNSNAEVNRRSNSRGSSSGRYGEQIRSRRNYDSAGYEEDGGAYDRGSDYDDYAADKRSKGSGGHHYDFIQD